MKQYLAGTFLTGVASTADRGGEQPQKAKG
jgi:hypothetical protein